jgi:hypothetical protein
MAHGRIGAAAPGRAWELHVDATACPEGYRNARRVELASGDVLRACTAFRRTTFGLRVHSAVTRCEPYRFPARNRRAPGSAGHHRWRLDPHPGGGADIVTEEVQTGNAARLPAHRMRPGSPPEHQRWIEHLDQAEPWSHR